MRSSSSTENSTTIHCPQTIGLMHMTQGSQMLEPKLERIVVDKQTIWRVTYAGMSRDFDSDWQATGFLHNLWLSNKKQNNLIPQ